MQPAFPNTEYYVEVELRFWYKHYLPEMEARIELCLLSLTRASHGAQTRQLFSYLFFLDLALSRPSSLLVLDWFCLHSVNKLCV